MGPNRLTGIKKWESKEFTSLNRRSRINKRDWIYQTKLVATTGIDGLKSIGQIQQAGIDGGINMPASAFTASSSTSSTTASNTASATASATVSAKPLLQHLL